ncbi:integrase domain-containing protein [Caballeronia novacaledonica]|uniref:Tyrosine-type recombinase/integrase n=1 Tax=Caballeronia novacaledonica TaxID=1544861 RepID=A0AA37IIS7_9BURK|nr:integrase domain-containing protein [Caballeronia novacaledonica]GJH30576.1 tyrosine-type recombinase/integrase [Caballeronia novacaledonica]
MTVTVYVKGIVSDYPELPADFRSGLERIFTDNVNRVHSRTRVSAKPLSVKTQSFRLRRLCRSFVELRQIGFALQTPYALREKHIEALVALWHKDGQSPGTIENKLTYFRAFTKWINKPTVVKTMSEYIDPDAHDFRRSYVATEDKSWDGRGIDAVKILEEIAKTEPVVAMQMKLQAAFGLRVEESFLLRPKDAVRKDGKLNVVHGTKGGRARVVPIEFKMDVLLEAAHHTNRSTGSTIPDGYTKTQWKDHFYTVLKRYGVTKSGLGVTCHGLRHQFLQQMFEKYAGVPAPIKRSDERADPALHREAMQAVVEAAGHSKAQKAGAYLSSYSVQRQLASPKLSVDKVRAAIAVTEGNISAAAKALGISRQKVYRTLAADKAGDLATGSSLAQ